MIAIAGAAVASTARRLGVPLVVSRVVVTRIEIHGRTTFRCELESRWQATAGRKLWLGSSVLERVFNQPLADNWLTIGSGSRFPAVAPSRKFPNKNEGQR